MSDEEPSPEELALIADRAPCDAAGCGEDSRFMVVAMKFDWADPDRDTYGEPPLLAGWQMRLCDGHVDILRFNRAVRNGFTLQWRLMPNPGPGRPFIHGGPEYWVIERVPSCPPGEASLT